MIDDVLGIPDQLRDALWRVESARLRAGRGGRALIVCGMGGSAIGGDLAAAALGDRLTRPLLTVRGYALPSWATPEWTVLCSSYSGETEETLACFEAAEALGARRIVASTGGALVDRAREAERAGGRPAGDLPAARRGRLHVRRRRRGRRRWPGSRPRIHTEIDAAAAFLDRAGRDAAAARAAEIAAQLDGTVPVVYGADLTAPVARRWKTPGQRERQAPGLLRRAARGRPQRALRLGRARRRRALAAVFLEDRDQHPRDAPPLRADRGGGRGEPAPPRSGSRPRARPASRGCSGR